MKNYSVKKINNQAANSSGEVTIELSTPYVEIPQITITTGVNITTDTTATSAGHTGIGQKGRNVIIDNTTAIQITVNGGEGFCASYVKHGQSLILFAQGAGRTLVPVDGTLSLNGIKGSTATISSIGTTDYLRISNA